MEIDLPRKVSTLDGGQTDKIVLVEPEFRHVMLADKCIEQLIVDHTVRARDIKLLSLVAKIKEEDIRELPISIVVKATAYLREFCDGNFVLAEDMFIPLMTPLRDADGQEYPALVLEEPTTGAVEAAERTVKNGRNPFSLRQFQQILISKCSDLPDSLVPQLPISVANKASSVLAGFMKIGPEAGRA